MHEASKRVECEPFERVLGEATEAIELSRICCSNVFVALERGEEEFLDLFED